MGTGLSILIDIIVFAVVVAVATTGLRMAEAMWDVRRRLGTGANVATGSAGVLRAQGASSPFLKWVQRATADDKDKDKLARDLRMAGFTHPGASAMFVVARFGLAIGLPLAFIVMQAFNAKPITGIPLIVFSVALCGLGLVAPRAVVDNRSGSRREQLEQEFPDSLDLMVVCVEAGLGLEAAFVRVSEDVEESHPRIAEEFNRMSEELRAGRSRADALRNLAERSDVDAVRSFVALLIQTDSLGTSVGQTLKTYAAEMREHRFLKAEEKAMRVPVLMTIPLVVCILPVIVTALMLPPIIDVIRTMLPALKGH
ncbi:MAG: type II secretion system F family protein [Caulobacteraceae bacterium]